MSLFIFFHFSPHVFPFDFFPMPQHELPGLCPEGLLFSQEPLIRL